MSSKKDKFLESAQKFILKGQLDRAIKDYEQVVALDPNDIRHRQRLAELLVRANRKEEAIGEYEAIGKYYGDNSFYLKAIAVYKQIQKLDPDNIRISHNLATLNEKQGLTGNALAEYSRVYSYYDKGGKRPEALSILEKMIAIDPDNLNTRLKFAETHFAAGNAGKAYEDFVQIALLLRKRGDESAFHQVCDRVRYLFPDKKGFALELVISRLADGDAASVIPELQEITKKDPENLKAWQLLTDALRTTGQGEELKVLYQKIARLFPDELSPREGLIQCALDDDNVESALFLLKLHGPLFLEKGAHQYLERAYLRLLERTPQDTTLLHGLKNLYEVRGEQAKLSEIVARLAFLTRDEETEKEESRAEGSFVAEPAPVAAVAPVEPMEPVPEATWEEEIDLSLADEEPVDAVIPPPEVQESTVFGGEPLPDEPEEPAEVTVELDFPEEELTVPLSTDDIGEEVVTAPAVVSEQSDHRVFGDEVPQEQAGEGAEVALELELTEDELVELAELYGQPGADEAAPHDLLLDVAEEEAQQSFPCDALGPLPDELSFSEDEYVELEAEALAEVEAEGASPLDGYDKYSLDGLFSAFKKGLDQQLDKEDTETHYNLGIAYKEMGLYDDAVAEFEAAALDPRRKVDCLVLQGICCREKGDYNRAETILSGGIALPGVTAEELAPLKYELALIYEAAGRIEDALLLYCEITAASPGFRDAAEKITALHGEDAQEYYDLDLVELDGEVE